MRAEIINVGTEILLGGIVNLNSRYLSEELASLGIGVYYQTSVGDNAVRLKKVLSAAVSRSDIIILTGGLGPTADDITKETVAAALSIPLVEDTASLRHIENYFAAAGKAMPEANRKQALCPRGSVVFKNDVGTAPGYALSAGKQHIIMLPGPPAELTAMFEGCVKKYLEKLSDGIILSQSVRIFGMGESEVAETVADLLESENPTVAPYAKDGEVELRVTARAENSMAAHRMSLSVIKEIEKRLGDYVYTTKYNSLQETVVEMLKAKNMGISTAESCTAGLLSSRITEIPGASQVFNFGLTAYANEVKHEYLGVKTETLEKYGAVSEQTAIEMAMGAREHGVTQIGVGITGVAGPAASESKPAGLVYVALCDEKHCWCRELRLIHKSNDRDAIRNIAVMTALDMTRRYLEKYPQMPDGMRELFPENAEKTAGSENIGEEALTAERETFAGVLNDNIFNAFFVGGEETNEENQRLDIPEYENGSYNFVSEIGTEGDEEIPEHHRKGWFTRLFSRDAAEAAEEIVSSEQESEASSDEVGSALEGAGQEDILQTDGEYDVLDEGEQYEEAVLLTEEDDEEETMTKEKNILKKIAKSIIPWKGDKWGEIVRKIIFLISLAVFIGAAIYLVSYFGDQNRNETLIDNVRQQWEDIKDDDTINEDGIYSRFEFLLEQNPDTIGWIKIAGTNIDNPVYWNEDITYYEHHNMAGEESRYGALFVDPSCYISNDGVDQNTVIYGHNTKDGSMFADLVRYRSLSYYRQHPTIQFDTIYRKGEYEIFAVMITNAYAEQDEGYVFPYMRDSFYSDETFLNWIEQVKRRSIINTGVEVLPDDEIITLSTCCYYFTEARMVVMARRVRDGEPAVDVSKSSYNENPLYPQAWYDKKGGEKPVFSDSSSTESTGSQSGSSSDVSSDTTSDTTASDTVTSDTTTSNTTTSNTTTSNAPTSSSTSSTPDSSSDQESTSEPSDSSEDPEGDQSSNSDQSSSEEQGGDDNQSSDVEQGGDSNSGGDVEQGGGEDSSSQVAATE